MISNSLSDNRDHGMDWEEGQYKRATGWFQVQVSVEINSKSTTPTGSTFLRN